MTAQRAEVISLLSYSTPSRAQRGDAEPTRGDRKNGYDPGDDQGLRHTCPGVFGVNQVGYEPDDPGREQQKNVDDAPCPVPVSADRVDQAPQEREAANHQTTRDEPGCEVLPLYFVSREVGPVAQKATNEKAGGAPEQEKE